MTNCLWPERKPLESHCTLQYGNETNLISLHRMAIENQKEISVFTQVRSQFELMYKLTIYYITSFVCRLNNYSKV